MQDKELYEQILQLEHPWSIGEVEIDDQSEEIRIKVKHARGTKFCCPECELKLPCHDHGEQRRWRYLNSCQFKTILVGKVPRVKCPEHGVKSVEVPWAEKHSRRVGGFRNVENFKTAIFFYCGGLNLCPR